MGKTANGAVWLDPEKTTPYDFYQYWRNVDDGDVLKCLKLLTFLPIEEILAMETWEGAKLNEAKEILAFELTKLVHGEDEANKAQSAAKALFAGGGNLENMPSFTITMEDAREGVFDIVTLLHKSGLVATRSEGRRAVEQGGVVVNDEKITDFAASFKPDELRGDGLIVRKGKKKFCKVLMD